MVQSMQTCGRCGGLLDHYAPEGLCPRCLLKAGLAAAAPHGGSLPGDLEQGCGRRIDRYELLEKIGEGGCGVVYLAEQAQPVRRHVALKVIKLGMDTKQVVARFEAERQALAMMDHPNIAKVLDAGSTETGRPYFVMELVRGVRITDYCDQNRLSMDQRLKLFIQVCHAVQPARALWAQRGAGPSAVRIATRRAHKCRCAYRHPSRSNLLAPDSYRPACR